jgi:hypothetical protein
MMAFLSALFSVILWKMAQKDFENERNGSGWAALFLSAANGAHAAHLLLN